jgi:TPR repeat protein
MRLSFDKETEALFCQAVDLWEEGDGPGALPIMQDLAEQEYTAAFNWVGYILDHGQGAPIDKGAAIRWYRRAADRGDPGGLSNLGICYRDLGYRGRASFWLYREARNGDGDAWLELAKLALKCGDARERGRAWRYLKYCIASKWDRRRPQHLRRLTNC